MTIITWCKIKSDFKKKKNNSNVDDPYKRGDYNHLSSYLFPSLFLFHIIFRKALLWATGGGL